MLLKDISPCRACPRYHLYCYVLNGPRPFDGLTCHSESETPVQRDLAGPPMCEISSVCKLYGIMFRVSVGSIALAFHSAWSTIRLIQSQLHYCLFPRLCSLVYMHSPRCRKEKLLEYH